MKCATFNVHHRFTSSTTMHSLSPQLGSSSANLLDLHFDVLLMVIDRLLHSCYWSPLATHFRVKSSVKTLIPLSLTCRTLREILLPHLFSTIHWPRKQSLPLRSFGSRDTLAMLSRLTLSDASDQDSLDNDIPDGVLPYVR
jgi:hypothetical protein